MTQLTIRQLFAPSSKYHIKCTHPMTPQYITIHNTANKASALAEISYMVGNSNYVSYHFAVDDKEAIQGLPLDRNAWHCGDGGYGKGNRQSIGIEICYSLVPNDPRYPQAEENGAILTALLLKQYGWGIDRVRKHQDWSRKYCPHRILDNGGWQVFLNKVQHYLNALNGQTETKHKEPQANVGLKPVEEVAREVINGKWGNGQARVQNLSQAGYNASKVQEKVDELLGKSQPKQQQTQWWVHLPKHVNSWNVYRLNGPYTKGNEIGKLAPSKFGGLDYQIERWIVHQQVAQINTKSFGKVAIYIAPGVGGNRWYEKIV